MIVLGILAVWVVAFFAFLRHHANHAPAEPRYVTRADILVTGRGVEIPLGGLESDDDIDAVLRTLEEIETEAIA